MVSSLGVCRLALAGLVLLIATITFSGLPQPYPHWPTIGPVPVDPELVGPGLLGIAALVGTLRDGWSVGAISIAVSSMLTVGLAVMSLHSLYTAEAGGVFWGGFVTLLSGVVLAVGVVVRSVLHMTSLQERVRPVRE